MSKQTSIFWDTSLTVLGYTDKMQAIVDMKILVRSGINGQIFTTIAYKKPVYVLNDANVTKQRDRWFVTCLTLFKYYITEIDIILKEL